AIGRAAGDELQERETRPLVGGGGGRMAASSKQPQLHRAPQSSMSSILQNFSQRFGSQWRKRSRRKRGNVVAIVPNSFYVAVGCFFVAFPVCFVLYILARHAVFGDEGDSSGPVGHIHEVPNSFANDGAFEPGESPVGNDRLESVGDLIQNQSSLGDNNSQGSELIAKEDERSQPLQSAAGNLPSDATSDLDATDEKTGGNISEQNEVASGPNVEAHADLLDKDNAETVQNEESNDGGSTLTEQMNQSSEPKETGRNDPEQYRNALNDVSLSASIPKEGNRDGLPDPSQKGSDVTVENEALQKNLRGSQD
ncbi:hypothetical protein ACHAWF_005992, partial [Thalassiosira exigua]